MMATVEQLTLPSGAPWTPPEPIDAHERMVLHILRNDTQPHRKEHLTALTGLPERTVRAAIERLRLQGWPIASSSGRAGYCLTWNPADLEALEKDLTSRALAALRVRRAIRRIRERRAA